MRVPETGRTVWRDGVQVPVADAVFAATDPAIQHALGLFETLALRGGECVDLEAHLERLASGAKRLGLSLPERTRLAEVLRDAAREKPSTDGWVKLIVSASGSWVVFAGSMDPDDEGRPRTAVTLPWRRGPRGPLSGLKTLNYGDHALGLRYARERGADEGLWLNQRGRCVEGCWSNLFVLRGKRLFTPSVREGLLPGIVRARVIGAAAKAGLTVHDGPLRLRRVLLADHVFVTSSLRGLCTLTHLDGRPLGRPGRGAAVARLARALGRRHLEVSGATFP